MSYLRLGSKTSLALIVLLTAGTADGQSSAVHSWVAFDAPVGYERRTTAPLVATLNTATGGSWRVDALGNLTMRKGSGTPRRVVVCGIDRAGFAVTQITDNGLLRVHTLGTSSHPLWEQAHEGQQLEVLTATGAVPAVSAIANGHFAQQHRRETLITSADDLWVDVGASSRTEVEALGIRLLDPVQRRLRSWEFNGHVAGAAAGQRAGCAAVVAAARGTVANGETMFVLSVQSVFGWPGLGGAVSRSGFRADSVTVFGPGASERGTRMIRSGMRGAPNTAVLQAMQVDSVRWVAPRVRHPGALVETVALGEAAWLVDEARRAAGVRINADGVNAIVTLPVRDQQVAARAGDPHASTMRMLSALADLPATPGDEWRVREAIRAQLPAWAKSRATVDSIGNLIVSAGPNRDTVVFMAHMDEVAYDVVAIARDGTVSLRARGGVVATAWEGQAAVLHLPRPSSGTPDTLTGIFVTRDTASVRRVTTPCAWFGMDSAALVARGVRVGVGVTMPKTSVRLAGSRFTGRSMDDRAGSTALLTAVQRIDPAALDHHVLFVWSVQEEGGLNGAQAMASRTGTSTTRIYSIDTFVSSESPLESPHFAYVRLGAGPVLRAIENGSISPPAVRDQVQRVARASGIPLQIGLTQGGTDGTAFTFYGAPNTGLSWPGRYSHTPAEVLDLRDVERLARLIEAVARQSPNR